MKPDAIVADSPLRRRMLRWGLAAPLALALAGCAPRPPALDGSFVQIWHSHLAWSRTRWRRLMGEMRALGCREVVLQWTGVSGGTAPAWQVPDAVMETIFDTASARGLNVRVGLPFDHGWWEAIKTPDPAALAAFFQRSREAAIGYLNSAPWPLRRRFGGWYIPYEIEQYSWADPARRAMLADWLGAISEAAQGVTGQVPAISTYFSQLPSATTLLAVWETLLSRAALRPMVQDGVGVAGMQNLARIAPLLAGLRQREAVFDVIVELFEQLPTAKNDGSEFRAQPADWERVRRQLEWAGQTGAAHTLAFAVEPWLTGAEERARALRRAWRQARF